ncbi:21794_t:CDS:2 [Dentiscutata erythropus]|uniref:Hexosyltransferase n=1 Tax=Dentiscutata erythropus TaxID=1348616 RepID=A0A9N9DHY5_9GLOM|nr:21794_t:CDS:2 [Dentiscutata erythropus]
MSINTPLESTVPLLDIINDTYTKPPPGVNQNLPIFIGIMTVYEKIEIRECLRKLYTHNNDALTRYLGVKRSPVTIRFILGLPKNEYIDKLEEESKMYKDIVILNITENMNEGKTFEYFKWFAKHREDNYIVKTDDDTFIHLIHYYRDLQDLPRKRVYYGNTWIDEDGKLSFMGGYTLSRDLIIDIVGSHWVGSNVKGPEDWLVGEWVCHVAKENKYFVHYVGYTGWSSIRQNPIRDFDTDLDLHLFVETIMIHMLKDIEKLNAIKDVYSKYEEGLPIVKVIRNSTAKGLHTKREFAPQCWEKDQILNQTLQSTYKNWFYEAWGFKEGKWYKYYGPVNNI